MPKPQCYMCDATATSREHVPPANLFPEAKDVGGKDYRVNLVTVPSCEAHNSKKKCDDEFLMVSLAGILGNNSIGWRHRFGKVDRAVRASADHLLKLALRDPSVIDRAEFANNAFVELIWGTPDLDRLTRCFEHIGYGLYRHHFRMRFTGKLFVHVGYLVHRQHNAKVWNEFIQDRVTIDIDGKPRHGSNQDVFYYQVAGPDEFGLRMMALWFYGGLAVYVAFQPPDVSLPGNFATALIAGGVRTIMTLGDRTYEFNPGLDT